METGLLFFLLAITLHNLEEALWLPAWSQNTSRFQKPIGKNEFRFAVIVITSLAYLATFLYALFPHVSATKYVLVGFLGAMFINAFFPHLLATILLKRYAPGVVTGVLLHIPINGVMLYQFFQKELLTTKEFVLSTVVVGGLLVALIPLLFRIGQAVTKQFQS